MGIWSNSIDGNTSERWRNKVIELLNKNNSYFSSGVLSSIYSVLVNINTTVTNINTTLSNVLTTLNNILSNTSSINTTLSNVLTTLNSILTNTTNILTNTTSIDNKLTQGTTTLQITAGSYTNTSGTISITNLKSISIRNTGNSAITIASYSLGVGEILEISATWNNNLGNISFDCTGSSLSYIATYY